MAPAMAKANRAHHQAMRTLPSWAPVVILPTTPRASLFKFFAIVFVALLAHLGHIVERGGEGALPLRCRSSGLGARVLELHGQRLEVIKLLPDLRFGFASVVLIGNLTVRGPTVLRSLGKQRHVFVRHAADIVHRLGRLGGIKRRDALFHLAAELCCWRYRLFHQIATPTLAQIIIISFCITPLHSSPGLGPGFLHPQLVGEVTLVTARIVLAA